MPNFDESVINFAVYEDSVEYVGMAGVTLPNLAAIVQTLSGAGIAGNSVRYWATYIDGAKVREIDPLNFICEVNGVDYLADVRKAIGK